MSDRMKPLIAAVAERSLTAAEAEQAFGLLFDGEATDAQIGGMLMAMRVRGETVDEIAAAARAMRGRCVEVKAPAGAIDIVGTGGDGKGTLNISTAAAFVVAGAGVPVAKHGNRNLSSKSGAADALGQMGINVMVGAPVVERALSEAGIGFMMAPMHHPRDRPRDADAPAAWHPHAVQRAGAADQPRRGQTATDRRLRAVAHPPHGGGSGRAGVRGRVAGAWRRRH